MHGLVVYASKYGSTAEYASLMARKLHTEALNARKVSSGALSEADLVILGSPVYAHSILPEMARFLVQEREILAGKSLAAFVVCGDSMWNPAAGEGGNKNLEKLTRFLPVEPFATAILGGRLRMAELDDEDGPRIRAFYDRIGREPVGFDRMELGKVGPFVGEVKKVLRDRR